MKKTVPSTILYGILFVFLFFTGELLASDCEYHRVVRVIDGDTFVIDTGQRVRLLGVDTPETVDTRTEVEFFGMEASRFLKELILHRRVCLRRDVNKTIDRDRYGRLLRYVWVGDVFVNREIIKQGYGFVYTRTPFQFLEEFRRLQKEAAEAERGLWNKRAFEIWKSQRDKSLKKALTCKTDPSVLCPWQARDYIGKTVSVRMFVSRVVEFEDILLLNSAVDYRSRENLTIVIKKDVFKKIDPYKFYNRAIQVRGEVSLYEGRPEIVVKDQDAIEILN